MTLGPNAQRALQMLGPEAKKAFDKHASGNMSRDDAKPFSHYVAVSTKAAVLVNLRLISIRLG